MFRALVGHDRCRKEPQTRMRPAGFEPAAYGSGGHRSIP